MLDAHEQEQDRKIKENTGTIMQMVDYLHEIRDHFEPISAFVEKVPTKWKASMRLLRAIIGLGAIAAVILKGGVWYYQKQVLHEMAERYIRVASDLYYGENNADVAMPFVDKALALEDENPDYIFFKAYMKGMASTAKLLNLDRPFTKQELNEAHQALAEAKYLEQIAPKRAEPYILQGQILAALKETTRAKEALDKAVTVDPRNDFAYVRLALVQLDEKDVVGAKASLATAESINPSSKWVWLWKGVIARENDGDVVAARGYYEKALQLDPRFDLALYNMGASYISKKEKNYAKARENYLKVLRVNPDYKEACYAIGMTYGYEDNYAVAKVWLEKAIALDSAFLTAHKFLGVVLGEMKDYKGAIASYDAALHLDPMNADIYVRRAKMELALGNDEAALRDLEFALDLDPTSKRNLLYLGDFHAKKGDLEKALGYYDKAVAQDAKYAEAHAGRAAVLYRQGKKAEALEAIEIAEKSTTYKPERFRKIKESYKQ